MINKLTSLSKPSKCGKDSLREIVLYFRTVDEGKTWHRAGKQTFRNRTRMKEAASRHRLLLEIHNAIYHVHNLFILSAAAINPERLRIPSGIRSAARRSFQKRDRYTHQSDRRSEVTPAFSVHRRESRPQAPGVLGSSSRFAPRP